MDRLDKKSFSIIREAVSNVRKALPAVKTNVGEFVEVKFNLPFKFSYE